MLKFTDPLSVTPERKGALQFGEKGDWLPFLEPIDVVRFLDAPQILIDDAGGQRILRSGRLYARRGTDLTKGDRVALPEGVFTVTDGPDLDYRHPMNGHDFGWMKFHIRTGG